jgi:hypothetical protein
MMVHKTIIGRIPMAGKAQFRLKPENATAETPRKMR